MCKYYAHAFVCQHTTFTFARYCTAANFTQKPCEQRQIWHTIGLDEACDECQMWFPDQYGSVMPRSKTKGAAAAAAAAAAVAGAPPMGATGGMGGGGGGVPAVANAVAKASGRARKQRCS